MFVLKKLDKEDEKFMLLPIKQAYTVGRLSTDLILSEDLSISRTHVRLCLSGDGLIVEDLGSMYGTFINTGIEQKRKISPKTPTPLKIGDRVRFGALKNIWQLSQQKWVTTASAVSRPKLIELDQLMKPLGGAVVPSWTNECTHLTMDTVTITVKLLHALLENKPIVRLDFWQELVKFASRVHVSEDWPKPEDFAPAHPPDMPSIKWRVERTKLFAGITFVFMNRKHLEMYGPVVVRASGTCKDLHTGVRKPFLTKKNVVVIQYVSSTQSQATETIYSVQGILEQAGLRPIPDYEIGLALLHCSMEKFCNPSHAMIENSMTTTESMDSSILVPNTERTQTEHRRGTASEFVVAESVKSQVYALSLGSEKEASEPQESGSAPKQVESRMGKRNNPIYLDSSDEEQPSKKSKTVIASNPMPKIPIVVESSDEEQVAIIPKRKIAILMDSSDEEQPQEKKTKTVSKVNELNSDDEAALQDIANSVAMPIDKDAAEPCPKPSNNVRQKKTPTVSPRRSTRSNPLLHQNEEEEVETTSPRRSMRGKPTTSKAKLTDIQSADDSAENEGLFQFKSKSPIRKPDKINVRNFLEKSQNPLATEKVAPAAAHRRKRRVLKMLTEDDSDDNSFQFSDISSNDDTDDEGLRKKRKGAQKAQSQVMTKDDDSVCTKDEISVCIKAKSKYIVPKPKGIPRKINTSGWLSCSGLHEDVKPETMPEPDEMDMDAAAAQQTIKEETKDTDDKLAHAKWLATIRNSIQVRMCNMNISVRCQDETDAASTTASDFSGRKNFKKFVKKNNAHPQQQILELKRMQLAEGMVSVL